MKSFHESYINQIKQLADQMRNEAMPTLTEELFALFETTGNRLQYEAVYFARRKFLAVFGIAAYVFKRPQDVAKLEEILDEICREECWALPAHVNRRENENWRSTVDLFASETAQALAEIVTIVNETDEGKVDAEQNCPRLSKQICERVHFEIERRVLTLFESHQQGWECSDHNWNAVCCGSIGSAAIHLLAGKEEKRLDALIKRICYSLTFYLDGFGEDGACMEGIGYFTYGMTYFVGFAEQVLRYSKGSINLFDNHKVRNIAEFQQKIYFSNGQTISFSDGEKQAKYRMGLTRFLAKQYETVRIPNPAFACDFEADSCYRFMGLLRDYLWAKDDVEAQKCEKQEIYGEEKVSGATRHDVLPFAQWSICESKNGVGFAIKGGHNGEPHNHNDVGSFLYMAGDEQLICDLGAGEYTADYFGEGRYNILCNSSEGHSVPIINDTFQKAGKRYRTSAFEADGAGITKLEFAGAYKEGEADRITREAVFSPEDGRLTITDEFELPGLVGIVTEQVVTQGTVEVSEKEETGQRLIVSGKNASCILLLPANVKNLRILEKMHSNHRGEPEAVRLIRWDVTMQEKETIVGEKKEKGYGISKYTIWCEGTELE